MKLSKTDEIDLKIERLRQQKKHLEKTQALELYKSLQNLLKDTFSSELVRMVVEETWQKASDQQKEMWLKNATSFRTGKKSKTQHDHTKNHATIESEKHSRLSLFKSSQK